MRPRQQGNRSRSKKRKKPAARKKWPRVRAADGEKPVWDRDLFTLSWRGEVIRVITREAESLEPLLRAFQDANWPSRIDNPLTDENGVDPRERLHNAVKHLNRQQPMRIRFERDGHGGICWFPLDD